MELKLDTYFWAIDRLGLEDNPKNNLNKERETATLNF
jgi:hypothetical protein